MLSQQIREQTEQQVQQGLSIAELAQCWGISYASMRTRLVKWGLKARRPDAMDPTKGRPRQICEMYKSGATLRQVGDAFGLTHERIRQILVKCGVTERHHDSSHVLRSNRRKQILALYVQGHTIKEARAVLGLVSRTYESVRPSGGQRKAHRSARFWQLVNKNGPWQERLGSRCWIWTGNINRVTGYGRAFGSNYAHRIAYEMAKGTPKNPMILHRCDNPACVNPDHLYSGTAQDNARDREQRSKHTSKALSPERAAELREAAAGGASIAELRQRFNRCGPTIRRILNDPEYPRTTFFESEVDKVNHVVVS